VSIIKLIEIFLSPTVIETSNLLQYVTFFKKSMHFIDADGAGFRILLQIWLEDVDCSNTKQIAMLSEQQLQ
jgi:hypothetical protein